MNVRGLRLHLIEILLAVGCLFNLLLASNAATNDSQWIQLLTKAKYVRTEQPTMKTGKKTSITFIFNPRNVFGVELKTMDFVVDLSVDIAWKDKRLSVLKAGSSGDNVIPKEVAVKLWTPSIQLTNCKACDDFLADSSSRLFELTRSTVTTKYTKTITFTCDIDLHNYPFDVQECKIRIEKRENTTQVPFNVHFFPDPLSKDINVPPEYVLTQLKWKNCTESHTMECMELVFRFRRLAANHVMLVFIPTMLIVILSWISFWLDAEASGPRVALGLTSLLTLATQLNNSQRNLPPVATVKAIDIWMFSCMFMVFGSLIEFAVANFYATKKNNSANIAPPTTVKSILKSPTANIRRRNFNRHIIITKKKPPEPVDPKQTSPIDIVARIAFPVSFVIFNIVYWGYFATKDE